jgi:hypothetical protein
MKHHPILLRGLVLAVMLVTLHGALAYAQIFSPGELSAPHADLDSLGKCDSCHSAGSQVEPSKCMKCHPLIASRRKAAKGYHGRGDATGACSDCHNEHKGRGSKLIAWPGGKEASFDHKKANWPLTGAHAKKTCTDCHQNAFIADKAVLDALKKHPTKITRLGLSTACEDCHFNEHRGQLGRQCSTCHTTEAFKPAQGFAHEKAWKLEGAHSRVACDKCHPAQTDTKSSAQAIPKPRSNTFSLFKPVAHEVCTDCHKDPHSGRFGVTCLECHSMETFRLKLDAKTIEFHEKSAFPLRGRHRSIPCARCHMQKKDGSRHYKPIAHDRCMACHPNAHPDIAAGRMETLDCSSCHRVEGFKPVAFELNRHEKTDFPLNGAHRAVACPDCHIDRFGKKSERNSAERVRGKLAMRVRSPWNLALPAKGAPECSICHQSPHRDQFGDATCTKCHSDETWRLQASFDHAARTTYPLEGKHAEVTCDRCHPKQKDAKGDFIKYKPIPHTACDDCHTDPHLGQFRLLKPARACADCHRVTGFKPSGFDHNAASERAWPLNGQHAKIACDKCHVKTAIIGKTEATRYRTTVRRCLLCHQDPHEGAYREAARLIGHSRAEETSLVGADEASADETTCEFCHEERSWQSVRFDHSSTGYPLLGLHAKAACVDCHKPDSTEAPSRNCADCHRDPHGAALGWSCADCHNERGFTEPEIRFIRHNQTGFPLTGAHAVTPCTECHRDVRDVGFNRTPGQCAACHQSSAPVGAQAVVDHSGFTQDCKSCHSSLGWENASFLEHGRCFQIGAGSEHAGVACRSCHVGSIPAATGTCNSGSFSCTQCHGCQEARHRSVNGYECKEQKCYRCHPSGGD